MIGSLVICIYTVFTPMKDGKVWQESPMIEGVVIKEETDRLYVDFSKSLRKMKVNSYWNTKVIWVKSNQCLSNN